MSSPAALPGRGSIGIQGPHLPAGTSSALTPWPTWPAAPRAARAAAATSWPPATPRRATRRSCEPAPRGAPPRGRAQPPRRHAAGHMGVQGPRPARPLARSRSPDVTRAEASHGARVRPQAGVPFLSCFYEPTRSTSPHKCTATRDQAAGERGRGAQTPPPGVDTEPGRDGPGCQGRAQACPRPPVLVPWVPAGLGHTTVQVWATVKPCRWVNWEPLPEENPSERAWVLTRSPRLGGLWTARWQAGRVGEVWLPRGPGAPWRHVGVPTSGKEAIFLHL